MVAINRGKRHGLAPGNVLGVFYRGEEVRDRFDRQNWSAYTANYDQVRLPDERSATILLFTVNDRMSYGLVVQSSQVIRRGDFIAHPQLRPPRRRQHQLRALTRSPTQFSAFSAVLQEPAGSDPR